MSFNKNMQHKYTGLKLIIIAVCIAILNVTYVNAAELQLKVDTDQAADAALHKKMLLLNDVLAERHAGQDIKLSMSPPATITAEINDQSNIKALNEVLETEFPELEIVKLGDSPHFFALKFKAENAEALTNTILNQAQATIKNRLALLGVSAEVDAFPPNRLTVTTKDDADISRINGLVTQTALLEFKTVNAVISEADLEDRVIAAGFEIAREHPEFAGYAENQVYILAKDAVLSGEHIIKAESVYEQNYDTYWIAIEFDEVGTKLFTEITGVNVGWRLAIVLDGAVLSAPVIQERITGGKAIIAGDFTEQETRGLAALLQAGSLPAPVKTVE